MNIEFREEFTDEESKSLEEQDICLDDWDLALITFDIDEFNYKEYTRFDDELQQSVPFIAPLPKSLQLLRLLEVDRYNEGKWRSITWKGKPAVIGIVYHG